VVQRPKRRLPAVTRPRTERSLGDVPRRAWLRAIAISDRYDHRPTRSTWRLPDIPSASLRVTGCAARRGGGVQRMHTGR
jgi:hypothetical protein